MRRPTCVCCGDSPPSPADAAVPGLIVGNLGFEAEIAAAHGVATSAARLSPAAAGRASALATLLRGLARSPADALWTPAPVDPSRIAPVVGLPTPRLVSGPFDGWADDVDGLLAWGESDHVARWRQDHSEPGSWAAPADAGTGALSDRADARRPSDLIETLWRLPAAPPEVARHANHRAYALELARELGCALPGARMIGDVEALRDHLRQGGAAASPDGMWVLKAPWSAAGRDRVIGRGMGATGHADDAFDRQVRRLIARFGPALFEPWMPRLLDVGCCAVVDSAGVAIVGAHRQLIGPTGGFGGIELDRVWTGGVPAWLDAAEWDDLERTVMAVGERLRRDGYRGPFSVDAWRYRDGDGRARFHTLGEINARMSFGLVARVTVDRVAEALARSGAWVGGPTSTFRLRIGRDIAAAARVPLLLPAADDPVGAWLEIVSPAATPGTTPPRRPRAIP